MKLSSEHSGTREEEGEDVLTSIASALVSPLTASAVVSGASGSSTFFHFFSN